MGILGCGLRSMGKGLEGLIRERAWFGNWLGWVGFGNGSGPGVVEGLDYLKKEI